MDPCLAKKKRKIGTELERVLREGLPDSVSNCHKNLTDSNRAGQFYSREKWPKAPVLRWIGDNRPVQRRTRGEEGNAKVQRRKVAKGSGEGRREEGNAKVQRRKVAK